MARYWYYVASAISSDKSLEGAIDCWIRRWLASSAHLDSILQSVIAQPSSMPPFSHPCSLVACTVVRQIRSAAKTAG